MQGPLKGGPPLISVGQPTIFGIVSGQGLRSCTGQPAQRIANKWVDAALRERSDGSLRETPHFQAVGDRGRRWLLLLLLLMAAPEPVEFTVAGRRVALTRDQVIRSAKGVAPDTIRTHAVVVGGARYPVKQVVALATGMDPLDFNTNQARGWLRRLGFAVERVGGNPRRMLRG